MSSLLLHWHNNTASRASLSLRSLRSVVGEDVKTALILSWPTRKLVRDSRTERVKVEISEIVGQEVPRRGLGLANTPISWSVAPSLRLPDRVHGSGRKFSESELFVDCPDRLGSLSL